MPTFKAPLTLYSYQVDPFYHARLTYYLQILQEAAGLHAYKLDLSIPQLQKMGMTRLLLRTKLTIMRYLSWPEDQTVTTWPQRPWKFYYPRTTIATDSNDKELFRAISHWMVVDLATHRPSRNPLIHESFSGEHTPFEIDPDIGRLKSVDDSLPIFSEYSPTVTYGDADFNGHINNISYVSWMLDSLPFEFRDNYKVSEIDISYVAETYRNDQINIETTILSEGTIESANPKLCHVVKRIHPDGSDQIVSLAHTTWALRNTLV
ncbi:MAG: thioesterase [Sphaerochaetaceae bacterium]|nr:thioesterase [Sphaerochaetaceae bacterium]